MASYRVVAVDENGNPLKGVSVVAYSLRDFPAILQRVKTDKSGAARFTGIDGPVFFDAETRRGLTLRERNFPGRYQIQLSSLGETMNADYVVDSNGLGTHYSHFGDEGALAEAIATGNSKFIWVCASHNEPEVTAGASLDDLAAGQVITVASGGAYHPTISIAADIDVHSTSSLNHAGTRIVYRNIQFSVNSGNTANLFSFQSAGKSPTVELENFNFVGSGTWRASVINGPGQTVSQRYINVSGTLTELTTVAGVGSSNSNLGFNGNTASGSVLFVRGCKLVLTNLIFRVADTHAEPATDIDISDSHITLSGYAFQMTFGSSVTVSDNTFVAAYNGKLMQWGTEGGIDVRAAVTGNYIDMSGGGSSSRAIYVNNFTGGLATEFSVIGNAMRGPGSGYAIEVGSSSGGTMVLEPNGFYNWTAPITGSGAVTTFHGPVTFSTFPSGLGHNILSATHSDSLTGTVVRGDIIVGNSTPKWGRLAKGAAGSVLFGDGTDSAWTISPKLAGYLRVGSASAPSNTTAGDINGIRAYIGADAAILSGLTLQVAGDVGISAQNHLRFYNGANSHYVGFVAGAPTADLVWTLPDADGTSGQAILTDGSGTLAFGDVSSGGGGGAVTMLADALQVEWTDQPAALTELFGTTEHRTKIDLTSASTVRLVARVITEGASGAVLRAQYSTDESTWDYLDGSTGPEVAIDSTGTIASVVVNLASGAKDDVFLRIVGVDGDGAADPVLGNIILYFDTISGGAAAGGAPTDAKYVTTVADATLSDEVVREFLGNYYAETYPASPTSYDDEFDDTSGNSGVVNGLNARWSWHNQGTSTVDFDTQGYMHIAAASSGAANWRIIEQAIPTGSWTIQAKYSLTSRGTNYHHGGIVLRDSTHGDFYSFHIDHRATNQQQFEVAKWSSDSSYAGSSPVAVFPFGGGNAIHVRIAWDTSNLTVSVSVDGIAWLLLGSFADSVGFDMMGIGVNEQGGSTGDTAVYCDYFRRIA